MRRGIDREQGLVVIKPSGVEYDELRAELMVVTDLNGKVVEGTLRPSSDLETHTLLYREFPAIGGVVHTHSEFATSFAQAGMAIPALGTTHADYILRAGAMHRAADRRGDWREIRARDGAGDCAAVCGDGRTRGDDPLGVPGCLVAGHGPFAWGRDAAEAAHNAVVLEYVARMAYRTLTLKAEAGGVTPGAAGPALLQETWAGSELRAGRVRADFAGRFMFRGE